MFNTQHIEKDITLWHQLINQERDFLTTGQTFLSSCTQKVELLKESLQNPTERTTALQLFEYLTLDERESLFNKLIQLQQFPIL